MIKNQVIYVDMDGVIANFAKEINALERCRCEQGFFANLEPIMDNVKMVEKLARYNKVAILTASPNAIADNDKLAWLSKYLPTLVDSAIIVRYSNEKVKNMRNGVGILFDDYGKNCAQWSKIEGNIACKIEQDKNIEWYISQML